MTSRRILNALDLEWAQLNRRASARRTLRTWARVHPALKQFSTLAEVVEAIQHTTTEQSREVVWALVDLAPHDALALRTVLQALVPGLGRELGWLLQASPCGDVERFDADEAGQIVLAAATEAIHQAAGDRNAWPLSSILRRVHRVVVQELLTEGRWRNTVEVREELPEHLPPQEVRDPSADLAELLAAATRRLGLSAQDAELVWLTRAMGYAPADLTDRFGATPSSLRRRRHRVERQLAVLAAAV